MERRTQVKKSVAASEKPVKAKEFDKELFKRSVEYNVRTLYRKNLEEADAQQIFQAVSYAIKDRIVENWMETQKAYEKEDPKMVYYMSMEFLMGRALGNNLINLKAYKPVAEALEELGLDLNLIEDQEPDAALGNGGLGRLAACFLDSLATLGYPAYGCGIRYRYGMFKQEIRDGYQVEVPDNWLMNGNPFELRRPEYAKIVKFGGYVSVHTDENGRNVFTQEGYQSVKAIPFDFPIVGYGNGIVNTLRIWDAEPVECFQLDSFDKGDYQNFYTLSTAITAFSPLMFHSLDTAYSAPLVSSSARTFPLMASLFFRAISDSLSLPLMDTRM
jgi:glycogen phosphorylase